MLTEIKENIIGTLSCAPVSAQELQEMDIYKFHVLPPVLEILQDAGKIYKKKDKYHVYKKWKISE